MRSVQSNESVEGQMTYRIHHQNFRTSCGYEYFDAFFPQLF